MAQKVQVVLLDDIDGSEATQTVTFAYQGTSYEIDLNDDHASALEESFRDWINASRKVSGSRSPKGQRATATGGPVRGAGNGRDLNEVRTWLRSQGHEVKDRGRVAQTLLEEFDKAH